MARNAFISVALTIGIASNALASEPLVDGRERDPGATPLEIGAADYVTLGVLGAGLAAVYFGTNQPSEPRWDSGVLFDDAIRDNLRFRNDRTRVFASSVSDGLQGALLLFPVVVDAVLVKGVSDGEGLDMLRMLLIDAQSFLFTGLLVTGVKHAVGRKRPDLHGNQSFPSGHTGAAFTSAGLICSQHVALRLFGGSTADDVACGIGLAAATATSVLRILSDRHWTSDVLASAAIGLFSGYLMPALLHDALDPALPRIIVAPTLSDDGKTSGATFGLMGTF